MEKRWWLVEHPTRGVLTEIDIDGMPHFNWSKARGADGHWLFDTKEQADKIIKERIPSSIAKRCYAFGPIAQPRSK